MAKLNAGDRYRYVGIGNDLSGNPETITIQSVSWEGSVGVTADWPGRGEGGRALALTEVLALIECGIWVPVPLDDEEAKA